MTWQRKKVYLNLTQAIERLEKFCAYQERSQKQVENKCYDLGLSPEIRMEVMLHLIQNDFLNESRYAHAYVRGKSKIKSWGPEKILQGLKVAGVPEKLAREALSTLNADLSIQHIERWSAKKLKMLKFTETEIEQILEGIKPLDFTNRQKLMQFLQGKGFSIEAQKGALKFL